MYFKNVVYLLQPVSYTTDNSSITAYWTNFTDNESGISTYEVSLWKYNSCEVNSSTTLVTDWLTLSSNESQYQFVKQSLWVGVIPLCYWYS